MPYPLGHRTLYTCIPALLHFLLNSLQHALQPTPLPSQYKYCLKINRTECKAGALFVLNRMFFLLTADLRWFMIGVQCTLLDPYTVHCTCTGHTYNANYGSQSNTFIKWTQISNSLLSFCLQFKLQSTYLPGLNMLPSIWWPCSSLVEHHVT